MIIVVLFRLSKFQFENLYNLQEFRYIVDRCYLISNGLSFKKIPLIHTPACFIGIGERGQNSPVSNIDLLHSKSNWERANVFYRRRLVRNTYLMQIFELVAPYFPRYNPILETNP